MREKWQEAFSSPIHARAERSLVALTPSGDLFVHAKDLFVEANDEPLAPLYCWLTNRLNAPVANQHRNQNTDDERGNPVPRRSMGFDGSEVQMFGTD